MYTIFSLLIAFILGAGLTFVGSVIWAKRNKKKIERVLNFFDVQARIDDLLAKTDVDDKIKAVLKDVRAKVDKII
jgi:hypothetical protein